MGGTERWGSGYGLTEVMDNERMKEKEHMNEVKEERRGERQRMKRNDRVK